uniref:Uncharacterized protein n=1 Tax=Anguilla anguilla TaxID=7936 RepID=A0A0E9VXR3_ANGAN
MSPETHTFKPHQYSTVKTIFLLDSSYTT